MKDEGKFCPQNFQIWVAFLMGMVCIVIAIVIFNTVSVRGRLGIDSKEKTADDTLRYQGSSKTNTDGYSQTVGYLKETQDTYRAWIGIDPVDVTEAMAKQLGLNISGGVLASRVIENSPAQQAGLSQGDIIYEFDHREVKNSNALRELLSKTDPDTRVKVALFRERQRHVFYVKLGEASAAASTSSVVTVAGEVIPNDLKWGMVVSELTESLRKAYDIQGKEKGVLVMMVLPGSAADKAGLKKGDLVQQVNGTRIENLADFFETLRSADNKVLLKIYRQGAEFYANVMAVSPLLRTGGSSGSEQGEATESEGYRGMPSVIPPFGKYEPIGLQPIQGFSMAQEGIDMNHPPLYVPGYNQTQSVSAEQETKLPAKIGAKAIFDDSDGSEEPPVCKRIQELDI